MRVGGGAPQSMARGAHLAAAFPDYWAAALFGDTRLVARTASWPRRGALNAGRRRKHR
jgi:hypothetical protein